MFGIVQNCRKKHTMMVRVAQMRTVPSITFYVPNQGNLGLDGADQVQSRWNQLHAKV